MNAYALTCLAVIAVAALVFWIFRPRKCKECGGTGKRMVHDGAEADFHYSACARCKGTGWQG